MTMSISSAPASTAWRVSSTFSSRKVCPDGKPVATLATWMRAAGKRLTGVRDAGGIDADRGDRGDGRVGGVRASSLLAERVDLAAGVLALEGRQVDHADDQVERPALRLALDGSLGQARRPLLDADLVDATDAARAARPGRRRGRPRRGPARGRASRPARERCPRRSTSSAHPTPGGQPADPSVTWLCIDMLRYGHMMGTVEGRLDALAQRGLRCHAPSDHRAPARQPGGDHRGPGGPGAERDALRGHEAPRGAQAVGSGALHGRGSPPAALPRTCRPRAAARVARRLIGTGQPRRGGRAGGNRVAPSTR